MIAHFDFLIEVMFDIDLYYYLCCHSKFKISMQTTVYILPENIIRESTATFVSYKKMNAT